MKNTPGDRSANPAGQTGQDLHRLCWTRVFYKGVTHETIVCANSLTAISIRPNDMNAVTDARKRLDEQCGAEHRFYLPGDAELGFPLAG